MMYKIESLEICVYANMKWLLILFLAINAAGCSDDSEDRKAAVKPRPVQVRTFTRTTPPHASLVSATVGSWKTEEIGFEVAGRVERVVEPNTEIEGKIKDEDGNVLVPGVPIAKIDDERYRLQVATAKAQVNQAQIRIDAAKIELDRTMPAQIRAAEAERKLAEASLSRTKQLATQNATSQADLDAAEAQFETAVASVDQLQATTKAKEAELDSLRSQLLQSEQSLRDAERDLENCTLYSSFRGQIADISVVPGSVVSAGQGVATIQMMDPIKVEVEVSISDSRRLRNREIIPVIVPRADGTSLRMEGYLYLIDSVADTSTRTYTLTLLLTNEKELDVEVPDDVAITDQTWRLNFKFLPGTENGKLFVDSQAILNDDEGSFLWRIDNAEIGKLMPSDRMLKVSRLPIKMGESLVPFLGNWRFQEILVEDPDFDPDRHLVIGELKSQTGAPELWNGDTVLLSNEGQWKLRPGDVVQVDLSDDDGGIGYFVPMDAMAREDGQSFLFVVDDTSEPPTVAKRQVTLADDAKSRGSSGVFRVTGIEGFDSESDSFLDSVRYVSQGAHYLRDGEPVKVVEAEEAIQ